MRFRVQKYHTRSQTSENMQSNGTSTNAIINFDKNNGSKSQVAPYQWNWRPEEREQFVKEYGKQDTEGLDLHMQMKETGIWKWGELQTIGCFFLLLVLFIFTIQKESSLFRINLGFAQKKEEN